MENLAQRLNDTGWKVHCTRCSRGHKELVYSHSDYPGCLIRRECYGIWERVAGVLHPTDEFFVEEL